MKHRTNEPRSRRRGRRKRFEAVKNKSKKIDAGAGAMAAPASSLEHDRRRPQCPGRPQQLHAIHRGVGSGEPTAAHHVQDVPTLSAAHRVQADSQAAGAHLERKRRRRWRRIQHGRRRAQEDRAATATAHPRRRTRWRRISHKRTRRDPDAHDALEETRRVFTSCGGERQRRRLHVSASARADGAPLRMTRRQRQRQVHSSHRRKQACSGGGEDCGVVSRA